MKAGMSKVTITDHNRFEGCLILKERYGEKVLTGMEATAHFPEDDARSTSWYTGSTKKKR